MYNICSKEEIMSKQLRERLEKLLKDFYKRCPEMRDEVKQMIKRAIYN